MSKQDGGPAFPIPCDPDHCTHLNCQGMSLRDYFAAKAMQGLISEPLREGETSTTYQICRNTNRGISSAETNYAHAAYLIADAMLAERNRKQ